MQEFWNNHISYGKVLRDIFISINKKFKKIRRKKVDFNISFVDSHKI